MSIFSNILPILTVVGLWLCHTNAKKQKLNKVGPTLIRVPFIINFILSVIVYALVLIVCFMGFATAGAAANASQSEAGAAIGGNIMVVFVVILLFVAAAFVLEILYFRSVNNCLKNSVGLNQGYGINKQAGMFAAVVTIIKAVLGFIPGAAVAVISLGGGALFDSLFEALDMEMLSGVMDMLKGFGVMSLISSIISLAYNIMSGIMILQFCKKTSEGAQMA